MKNGTRSNTMRLLIIFTIINNLSVSKPLMTACVHNGQTTSDCTCFEMDVVINSAQIVVLGCVLSLQGAYCGNLALRQPAVQVNTYNSDAAVEHSVDGSTSGIWNQGTCSSTVRGTDPWWRVDLGKSYLVDEVSILNRADCCKAELQGFEIRIGDNLENDGNSNPKCGDLHTMATVDKKSFYCNPAMRGRYVNIRIPGASKILILCEVIVNPNPTGNIASQKTAVHSSQGNYVGIPSKAVDGNSDGSYDHQSCTHTDKETGPWWRVDLGTSKPVSEVFIVNRVNGRERLNNAEVRVGDVLDNNGNDNPRCGEVFSMITEYKKSVYCGKARKTGRFVNVRLRGTNQILTLCEVSVYSESKAFLRDKPVEPTRVQVYAKSPLKLTCPEPFGFPVPHVTWLFNGTVLQNSSITTLHLNSPAVDQNHNIECVVTNKHGADFHQFQLQIISRFSMCTDYKDIAQKTRGIQFTVSDSSAAKNDSSIDQKYWVRFVDSGSPRQLPESCVASWSCSTQAPGWLQGKHPSEEDNVVERTVCFSWNGDCCPYRTNVLVRKCYGHYVYKLKATEFPVKARYCTDVQKYQEHDDVLFTSPFADQDYELSGHVIHSEVNVSEIVNCMVCCLVEKSCTSFNYYPSDEICELNNATRLQDLNNFKPKSGSKYFEKAYNKWINVRHP